jgi:hypothetical protein
MQGGECKIIILTEPEHVNFVLLSPDMLTKFKEIINKTKNVIE